ncbi:hypothetical protein EXIGLDRAFT_383158 [Exidia glandulosa HHB12029]|uniref:Uncharacterized protein n=1 Tax=Exidia glandulosa HHB12029 TaxID=1314781 RepID=A0A165L2G3_EXIGL|nr:hypothetical protein EXIGLDRAFT_383158 [Exidia glandulosa HHB12029]
MASLTSSPSRLMGLAASTIAFSIRRSSMNLRSAAVLAPMDLALVRWTTLCNTGTNVCSRHGSPRVAISTTTTRSWSAQRHIAMISHGAMARKRTKRSARPLPNPTPHITRTTTTSRWPATSRTSITSARLRPATFIVITSPLPPSTRRLAFQRSLTMATATHLRARRPIHQRRHFRCLRRRRRRLHPSCPTPSPRLPASAREVSRLLTTTILLSRCRQRDRILVARPVARILVWSKLQKCNCFLSFYLLDILQVLHPSR